MTTVHFTLHAQRLLGGGKTNQAIAVLEEGLKEYPEYATAYALLARAYLQLQDIPTAYEVAAHAMQRFPYHRGLALLYEQLQDLLRSDQMLRSIVEHPSSNPAAAEEQSTPSVSSYSPSTTVESSVISESENLDTGEPALSPALSDDGILLPDAETEFPLSHESETVPAELPEHESPPQIETQALQQVLSVDSLDQERGGAIQRAENASSLAGDSTQETTITSARSREQDPPATMRIIETATIDSRAMRMLRSSNVRLIPGLEFAPLRIEPSLRKPSIAAMEFPPFRPIRGSERQLRGRSATSVPSTPAQLEAELRARHPIQDATQTNKTDSPGKTSLELLAEQLEGARITSPEIAPAGQQQCGIEIDEPTVISETMARIYEKQGAIEQAIKAYLILARQFPERRSDFEEKIAHLRTKL